MKPSPWHLGAGLVLLFVAVAAVIRFAPAGAEGREAGVEQGGVAPHGEAAAARDQALASRQSSAGSPAGAGAADIPPGLPPVDPVDPPGYATGLPDDVLFLPDAEARGHFADKLPFGVDDRDYIEFNRAALAALGVGSELSVRTPDDGAEHRLRVYDVQVHPNGDKSWMARVVDGSGDVLPAVFTQGVDSTLGSITTGAGTYSLEAEGRLGWIANVNDLRRHQDFSIPDVMEPGPGEGRAPVPSGP